MKKKRVLNIIIYKHDYIFIHKYLFMNNKYIFCFIEFFEGFCYVNIFFVVFVCDMFFCLMNEII